jgi:archaeosine synthase
MDTYLEIIKHCGPGKIGKFNLNGQIVPTPNFFHFPDYPEKHDIYLANSNYRTRKNPIIYDYTFFEKTKINQSKFGILPDFSIGFDIPRAIVEEATKKSYEIIRKYPGQGIVLTGGKFPNLLESCAKEFNDRPLIVIPNGQKLAEKPHLLAEIIPLIREAASPNSALYFPFAPTTLFPILVYMGIDFFDSSEAILCSTKGKFLTPRGPKSRRETESVCYCRACNGKPSEKVVDNPKYLFKHNLDFIRSIISEIRESIKEDRLRELVEEKSGYDTRAMTLLRILDHKKGDYLERYTPISSRTVIEFISQESYNRPEVRRWQKRLLKRYIPSKEKKLSIILPCSAKKPYHKSKSHMIFQKYIRRGAKGKLGLIQEITITSPLGIVPRELEGVYPASRYDVPVTGHWTRDEISVVVAQLKDYLDKAHTNAFAHVDGRYRDICTSAGINLGKKMILSSTALKFLSEQIVDFLTNEKISYIDKIDKIRTICDFQFGLGSGKYLLPKGAKVRRYQLSYMGEQVAALNPINGLLALTLRGGDLLKEYGKYLVNISFEPKTDSIFCVGVDKAGMEIRPGDEVIVIHDGDLVGVGKSLLNGLEMTRAGKGLAVKLRHRK